MRLHRYLGGHVVAFLIVAAPTVALLSALIQTMRFLPLVAGAGIAAGELAELALLSLGVLASATLPAAAVVSILAALSRLEAEGELLALRATGASPWQLAAAPGALCLVVALATGTTALVGEPAAHERLRRRVGSLLVRATVGSIRPGVVAEPLPGLTVFARSRDGETVRGLFIEDRRGEGEAQSFAASATIETDGPAGVARLALRDGAAHHRSEDGTLTRARFERLESELDLSASSGTLGELFPERISMSPSELARLASSGSGEARRAALLLHRRLAAAPAALGLGLLAVLLALVRPISSRPWAVGLGGCLVLAFHVAQRASEAGAEAGSLTPLLGGWLPAILAWAGIAAWVAIERARVLLWS